jgi:hypothetical protein
MKTNVYIVTEDDYEPMVYGIYESRELAQMRIDSFEGNSSLIIEERELNPDKDELLKGYKLYDVTLHRKGTRSFDAFRLQDEITYAELTEKSMIISHNRTNLYLLHCMQRTKLMH